MYYGSLVSTGFKYKTNRAMSGFQKYSWDTRSFFRFIISGDSKIIHLAFSYLRRWRGGGGGRWVVEIEILRQFYYYFFRGFLEIRKCR